MTPVKVVVTKNGKEREPLIIEELKDPKDRLYHTDYFTDYVLVGSLGNGELVARAGVWPGASGMQVVGELGFRVNDFELEVKGEKCQVPRDNREGNQPVKLVAVETDPFSPVGPRALIRDRTRDIEITIEAFWRKEK